MLLEDLFRAYYDARRNKRNTLNQMWFEVRLEDNLMRLYRQLSDRSYRVGRCVGFIVEEPVKREVFAASFVDRVVHHLYYNYVNEFFERVFIDDSYSCRVGRGTRYGVKRLDHHIRSCTENYKYDAWCMKLDLTGYFMSIDRRILYDKTYKMLAPYRREMREWDLVEFLSREIIFHDPLKDCFIKGSRDAWNGLPSDKSLFGSREGCGLPIGNLTSQLYSNVYLNDFDHFVKRDLKVKHYGRYVDDFYLVDRSREHLLRLRRVIEEYLWDTLRVKVHPLKVFLQPVDYGVQFLGAVVKPHRGYIAARTVGNFRRTLGKGEWFWRRDLDGLRCVMNSYLGLMVHYKSFGVRSRILQENEWVYKYGWVDESRRRFVLHKGIKSDIGDVLEAAFDTEMFD